MMIRRKVRCSMSNKKSGKVYMFKVEDEYEVRGDSEVSVYREVYVGEMPKLKIEKGSILVDGFTRVSTSMMLGEYAIHLSAYYAGEIRAYLGLSTPVVEVPPPDWWGKTEDEAMAERIQRAIATEKFRLENRHKIYENDQRLGQKALDALLAKEKELREEAEQGTDAATDGSGKDGGE